MTQILTNDEAMLAAAHQSAQAEANRGAQAFLDQYFGGEDGGACGFAWVTYYPKNKGNTKLGKMERKLIEAAGFRKNWTGKAWELWNPADHRCQSVDAKYAGACAYADRFYAITGVKLIPGERLD